MTMTLRELLYQHHIHRPSDLAKILGVRRSAVHMIWHGYRRLSVQMAERISQATGIPFVDLITATPPTPPKEDC